MTTCEQELCPFWGGDGCICAVADISEEEREQAKDMLR